MKLKNIFQKKENKIHKVFANIKSVCIFAAA
jgi:hypothetical protein